MFLLTQIGDSPEGNIRIMVILEAAIAGIVCEYRPDGWDAINIVEPGDVVKPIPPCFRMSADMRMALNDYMEEVA